VATARAKGDASTASHPGRPRLRDVRYKPEDVAARLESGAADNRLERRARMHNITFPPGEVSCYCEKRFPHVKQRGAELRFGCPLHGGKDPNFTMEAATGR